MLFIVNNIMQSLFLANFCQYIMAKLGAQTRGLYYSIYRASTRKDMGGEMRAFPHFLKNPPQTKCPRWDLLQNVHFFSEFRDPPPPPTTPNFTIQSQLCSRLSHTGMYCANHLRKWRPNYILKTYATFSIQCYDQNGSHRGS